MSSAYPKAAVPPDERYRPGELIHEKYQLVRQLGRGGMGTVWVARNTVLEVSVAIKLIALSEQQQDRDETAERLLREARAAARLDHPAIVRVFDFGRTSFGDPFIVMELLHGESLADVLNRDARLTAIQAVRAMLPIAEALASAHDKGVVHRDVKPENVILATTEDARTQPKLLDFGIASLQEHNARITQEKRLTREGSVVGTPAYMSPEQAMGKHDLDQRTDVWSFGVMLYELTTGRLPFDADNYNALLYEIIHKAPEACTAHAAGDDELWQILEVALRKRPEERWGSMRAFGEALALWLVDHGVREDICAASLRSAWLDSSQSLPARAELARTASGDEPVPSSTTPAVVPLPTRPPARTPRGSGVRVRTRWPALASFLFVCFLAGLVVVGRLVADESAPDGPAPEPAARGELESPLQRAAGEETLDHSEPLAAASGAPDESSDSAVPLDQALGAAESEPSRKAAAQKGELASQRRRPPAKPKKTRQHKPKDAIDFGF